MPKRIGIYSGSFDPIHKGHVAFALNALSQTGLDRVYFAPEVKPRRKPDVSHIAHRVAMINLALRSQSSLSLLELPGKYFLPKSTMAHIRSKFTNDQIVLLLGYDLFEHLVNYSHQWPHVEYLLKEVELAVAGRAGQKASDLQDLANKLPVKPLGFYVVKNNYPNVSSSKIRKSFVNDGSQSMPDLTPKVLAYAKHHWLYHDISKI